MKWNKWFWLCFLGFLVSFVLPSFGFTRKYLGYEVVLETFVMLFNGPFDVTLFAILVMSFPNWAVVLILLLRGRSNSKLTLFSAKVHTRHVILLILTIATALLYSLMWLLGIFPHAPIWGYYVWTLTTSAMVYIHYASYKERLNEFDDNNLEKHLVE